MKTKKVNMVTCDMCGGWFGYEWNGRRKKYCSAKCRNVGKSRNLRKSRLFEIAMQQFPHAIGYNTTTGVFIVD